MKSRNLLFTFLCLLNLSFAQIYTVGTGQTFPTLYSAISAVNNGVITGNIELQIAADCIETNAISLNQTGVASANYSSLIIYPTGSNRIISCNSNLLYTLMNFNGADNVLIDGRINKTGTTIGLSFELTTVGNTTTILFSNDATNNIVKYCEVKGATNSFSGVIEFGAGSTIGNDNNIIDHCKITKSGVNIPTWLVMSDGTAAKTNDNNSITYCELFEFKRDAVFLRSNSGPFLFSNNHFYQLTTFTPTVSLTTAFININTVGSHTIINNYFGGTSKFCNGSPFIINTTSNSFYAVNFSILVSSGNQTISGNFYQNLNVTTSYSGSKPPLGFVYCENTTGTISFTLGGLGLGNIIGSETGVNNILLTDNGTSIYGFVAFQKAGGSGAVDFSYNKIGGLTYDGSNVNGILDFVFVTGSGNVTVNNNIIGNATSNNIQDIGNRTNSDNALLLKSRSTGVVTVSNNLINNFTFTSTSASLTQYCYGVYIVNSSNVILNNNEITKINYCRSNVFTGFYISSNGVITTNNNSISTIYLPNSGVVFTGINLISSSNDVVCSQNSVGNSMASNINVGGNGYHKGISVSIPVNKTATLNLNSVRNILFSNSGSSNQSVGIFVSGNGNSNVSNSLVENLSSNSTLTGNYSISGIRIAVIGTNSYVQNNIIDEISNYNSLGNSTFVTGICNNSGSGSVATNGYINANKISSLSNSAGISASIYGIVNSSFSSNLQVYNNIILIENSSNTNPCSIYGIYDLTNASTKVYHNTIVIGGKSMAGSLNSSAYMNQFSNSNRMIYNNIFQNKRIGGAGNHRAIEIVTITNVQEDYNYLESTNSVVSWGGISKSFNTWVSTANHTNDNTGSIVVDTNGFVQTGENNTVKDTGFDFFSPGIVILDYLGNTRDDMPWRGAIEPVIPIVLNNEEVIFEVDKLEQQNEISFKIASETMYNKADVFRSFDGKDFENIVKINSPINNQKYQFVDDQFEDITYYKLILTNNNGEEEFTKILSISNMNSDSKLLKIINLMGEEVNEDYRGVVIKVYENGKTNKEYRF